MDAFCFVPMLSVFRVQAFLTTVQRIRHVRSSLHKDFECDQTGILPLRRCRILAIGMEMEMEMRKGNERGRLGLESDERNRFFYSFDYW